MNQELNRTGYHFRQTIVDEARTLLGLTASESSQHPANNKSQATIYKEADDAVRDLFPRIPNTDRDEIVTGSFRVSSKVPLSTDKLSYIVASLAPTVLAHISICLYLGGCSSLCLPTYGTTTLAMTSS